MHFGYLFKRANIAPVQYQDLKFSCLDRTDDCQAFFAYFKPRHFEVLQGTECSVGKERNRFQGDIGVANSEELKIIERRLEDARKAFIIKMTISLLNV